MSISIGVAILVGLPRADVEYLLKTEDNEDVMDKLPDSFHIISPSGPDFEDNQIIGLALEYERWAYLEIKEEIFNSEELQLLKDEFYNTVHAEAKLYVSADFT